MVEVKLDPVDPFFADKNTYVSMRVGEVQKLGRASTSRTYTFPPKIVGDRKYGKIDIFKRVGTCTVGILPESDFDQVVNIPLDDKSNATFKVTLSSFGQKPLPSSVDSPTPSHEKKSKDVNPKVLAAKTYLERHRLELRLSEAMQEVIRLEPEDPCAYIAEKLTKGGSVVSYIRKDGVPDQAPPVPPSATENLLQALEEPVPPPKSLPASCPPAPSEAPVSLENLKETTTVSQEVLANAANSLRPFHLRPSTNTWMRRRIKAPPDCKIRDVATSVQSIPNLGEMEKTATKTQSLTEYVGLAHNVGDTDLQLCLSALSPAAWSKLEQALADARVSVPALDEFAAAIAKTSDADLFAAVKGVPSHLRKELIFAAKCCALLR